jgi:DNA repair photolyase
MKDREATPRKGRGALSSPSNRYDPRTVEPVDDGWQPVRLPEGTARVRQPGRAADGRARARTAGTDGSAGQERATGTDPDLDSGPAFDAGAGTDGAARATATAVAVAEADATATAVTEAAACADAHDAAWPSPSPQTVATAERARSILTYNTSPDIPFDRSINAYRGCEHGCIYCYARPTHAYLDLSPGLDFETKLTFKANAAERLRQELAARSYVVRPIALGTNTDPYQPIEREHRLTRALLEVMAETRHPVTITTKGSLIERDLDLLADLSRDRLVSVGISVTTLDDGLKRILEPRAASPSRRLRTIERLAAAGVPVGLMLAPVIPFINDSEIEAIVARAAAAGAGSAQYVLLRLPLEVGPLFREWLEAHFPLRAGRVMAAIAGMRGGADYDARFGVRMRGEGVMAQLLAARFRQAAARAGLPARSFDALNCAAFVPPRAPAAARRRGDPGQHSLF